MGEGIKECMLHDLETGKGRWAREVKKLEREFGLEQDELKTIGKKELKEKIKEKDTMKWYKNGKKKIGYEECYRNSMSSKIYAKARTNTLQVEEVIHRRDRGHDKMCKMCGTEEDLKHFMINCPRLRNKRNKD